MKLKIISKRQLKRGFIVVLSLMLCFTFLLNMQIEVSAETLQDKYSYIQDKINNSENKIKSLGQDKEDKQDYIDTLMVKIEYTEEKIQLLDDNKTIIESDIKSLEKEIADTEHKITTLNKNIENKKAEFNELYSEYCVRLRAMYISGNVSPIELIIEGNDISSMLTRAEMIKQVSKHDKSLLEDLMDKMEEIKKEETQLQQNKENLEKDKNDLITKKDKLTTTINEYKETETSLSNDIDDCNKAIKSIDFERAEVMETLSADKAQLRQVEQDIQNAIKNAQTTNKPVNNDNKKPDNSSDTTQDSGLSQNNNNNSSSTSDSNTLSYPTSYRTISAGFPNYSSGAYHGGVDWPCPTGTPVHASASGTVLIAKKLNYSYGFYILIDHGNGLSTLYAHNSQLCVSAGDYVSRGELIAYSGSTGNSTGPHVHFEVRLNGTQVNPMNYLK